jgi:RNA polymerase sigma-32 factor
MDFLVCDDPLQDETVAQEIDDSRRASWLNQALDALNDRELSIIRERRLSEDAATLESLGVRFGISKERVRQIESRAIEKLRQALVDAHPEMAAGA